MSRFFIALEDDLMRLFGSERVMGAVSKLGMGDQAIEAGILSNSIERAQRQLEGHNFQRRKNVLSYDDIMNEQRKIIYKQRDEVLDGIDISDKMRGMIESTVTDAVRELMPEDERESWRIDELRNRFLGVLCTVDDLKYTEEQLEELEPSEVEAMLLKRASDMYEQKKQLFGDNLPEVERVILLRNVDSKWIDHLDAVDDLKGGIGLHAYAQRNPITEFRIASADMFDEMISDIKATTAKNLLTAFPAAQIERKEVARVTGDNLSAPTGEKKRPVVNKQNGVARNALCPCGSGKKFKRCCGKDLFEAERY
jgi:preprotein translocase subunit SecA